MEKLVNHRHTLRLALQTGGKELGFVEWELGVHLDIRHLWKWEEASCGWGGLWDKTWRMGEGAGIGEGREGRRDGVGGGR